MEIIDKILEFVIFRIGEHELKVDTLLSVLFIFLVTKLLIWIIKIGVIKKRWFKRLDESTSFSLYQIIRYVVWIIAIVLMLDTLEINITVLIAGSAALLVGVGLGLQQTFNDFVSGIILLVEGSTKIGDVLEIDGDVVMIQTIGLRTSRGLNRDDIVVIIPNSQITTNKVINWSHQSKKTRFRINVGVAYGSDVGKVIKVLEASALEHPDVTDSNLVEARLIDFGNSSLDFQVLFFSKNVFRIEKVKSDIRKIISRKFIENGITIPFPQLDLHVKEGRK